MSMFYLAWHNSVRKKSRFILTCLSVMVAFFLFSILAGINHALTKHVDGNNQYRLITSHKISITRSLPISYQQKISIIAGVEQVSYSSWFGGFFQNESNLLAMLAVDHDNYFDVFDEYNLTEEQLKQWQNKRTGLVISQTVADKYGWKVGDNVPLNSSIWMNREGNFTWHFTVSVIYQNGDDGVDDERIFLQHAYFDQARAYSRNKVSWLTAKIQSSADVKQVNQAIDALFANANEATRTTSEQVFIKEQAQQFADMAMVIELVVLAVFFTLLLIVCNTMVQANRERLSESAMMKALGFSVSFLTVQLYLESFTLLIIGAVLGCITAQLLLSFVNELFSDFLPGIAIVPTHYITVLLLVVIAAVICTLLPALTLKRLTITETLGVKA